MKNRVYQTNRPNCGSFAHALLQKSAYFFTLTVVFFLSMINAHYLNAQGCVLSCPPPSNPTGISIDNDCIDTLTIDLLGVGVGDDCSGNFVIQIMDNNQMDLGDTITSDMIDLTFMVVVTDTGAVGEPDQICMTAITVLDKQKPFINSCPADTSFACTFDVDTYDGTGDLDVTECGSFTVAQFDDVDFTASCVGDTVSKYTRTYIVTDEFGNSTSCTQMIALLKASLDEVEFPPNLTGLDALSCAPAPDTTTDNTGAPSIRGSNIANGLFCNLSFTYSDVIAPICSGGYKILRTFTVFDWCDNNNSIDSLQIIEVLDKTGPMVVAPLDMLISAGSGCTADVILPPADVTEDCSNVDFIRIQGPFGTMNSNGGLAENLPVGIHDIIYIAINDCDSIGRDTLRVTVADNEPPTPTCHASVSIPVSANGEVIIPAESLNAGSTDNCGPVFFKAKRMTPPTDYDCTTDGNPNYLFDDIIKFCCEDIPNNNIMVILRVYDQEPDEGPVTDNHLNGRWNECMMEVQIQDKLAPTITCPSNLTVSCQFPFDPNNLSVFGKVATNTLDITEICLDDLGNPGTSGVTCIGIDGFASDNCIANITDRGVVTTDSCGQGQIIRTFTVADNGGFSATCQQNIQIINFTPFRESDITWPEDYSSDNVCDADLLDPNDIPAPFDRPVLSAGECSLVSATHSDEVYDFSDSDQACFKIVRRWSVIDWCQFDDEGNGQWTYFQVIKSLNTVPPTINSSLATITQCTDDPNCGPTTIALSASATDDCSTPQTLRWKYAIDLDNDLIIDANVGGLSGGEINFDYTFPIGQHRVIYTVNDRCNNPVTREQIVNITSCNGPSAKCLVGLSMPLMGVDLDNDGTFDDGMATIWASEFDAGSDHPCGLDVRLAFSNNPDDISKVFDCSELGENQIQMYAIDENGLFDFCTTFIRIQDNNNICPDNTNGLAFIAGAVSTNEEQEVSDAMIYLNGSQATPVPTDSMGTYAFSEISTGQSYSIMPIKDGDDVNGVSTLDLLRIQKHLLGIQTFDSPYQYIAADANASGAVTALDILELRKLILGIQVDLPQTTSWRFVDAAYEFIDPYNPLSESFPEDYNLEVLNANMLDVDFVAVKVGDLNGNVVANTQGGEVVVTRKVKEPLVFLQSNSDNEVQLKAMNLDRFQAVQFTLEWNADAAIIDEVILGETFGANNINSRKIAEGKLMFSWYADGGVLSSENATFTFVSKNTSKLQAADIDFQITSSVTSEEAIDLDGNKAPIVVQKLTLDKATKEWQLHQNHPNPFSDNTIIPFELNEAGHVVLTIFDLSGKLIYNEEMDAAAGANRFELSNAKINATGVLVYELLTKHGTMTKRMIKK